VQHQLRSFIMADVNAVYQSEFLRAAQLQGQTRRATIEGAAVEILGQGEKAQQKIVLRLARVRQRLPLNKTNALALSSAWGPNTENWIGRQVELRPEKVLFSGKMVDSIRMQTVPEVRKATSQAATAAPAEVELGDAAEPDGWPEETVDDIPWEADP
jgi:hypothetical protein